MRCAERSCGQRAARAEVSQGETIRRDGESISQVARTVVELSAEAENLLTSVARPIVLASAKMDLPGVAPDNNELGVMLPYTPLQHCCSRPARRTFW